MQGISGLAYVLFTFQDHAGWMVGWFGSMPVTPKWAFFSCVYFTSLLCVASPVQLHQFENPTI
jgi:hypothetical protein